MPVGLSLAHISPPLPPCPTLGLAQQAPETSGIQEHEAVEAVQRYIDTPWIADGDTGLLLPVSPSPSLQVARHGNLLRLTGSSEGQQRQGGGKRGIITGLSRQARARLMRFVASIDRRVPASHWRFITLTYPNEWSDDARQWHRDLDAWGKRLLRRYSDAGAIWKCEFQQRGAPHFHLLLLGEARIDLRWLSQSWYEVVGSGDSKHLRAGTQVKKVKSWGGVTYYASKYIAKPAAPGDARPTGRLWGIINRKALPIELLELPLLWAEFHTLRRLMRRYIGSVKPQPWCPARPGGRRPWAMRPRSGGHGATLFVAETVSIRLLRGLSGGWQIDAGCPPARHEPAFWHRPD